MMKMKVLSIHEKGDASKESVLLEVVDDCDLCYFSLADTTYTQSGKISNKLRHVYWFPSVSAKKGELVVLRTGKGTNRSYNNNSGKKVHEFYWNLGSAVWNDPGDAAVLFQHSSWSTTKT